MVDSEEMWIWMMDWCKKEDLSPANNDIWDMAEKTYREREEKEAKDLRIVCGACGEEFFLSFEEEGEEYLCPHCGQQTVYGLCHKAGACQGRLESDCEGCDNLWTREVL